MMTSLGAVCITRPSAPTSGFAGEPDEAGASPGAAPGGPCAGARPGAAEVEAGDDINPLKDENGASFRALSLRGVPSTLILNKQGKEIARAEGVVDWDAPAARKFIEETLSEGSN